MFSSTFDHGLSCIAARYNKQLRRSDSGFRRRAAGAARHCAPAPRLMCDRAAAELRR